ncbi:hypothetical protein OE88DRAFT_1154626 [Heliocybe sulcata]|uniref:Cux N-terminal domain-containing protein n=1 Tax=Heliocybe sulcata TaxID=5364 RepID=A0A5C3NB71_9AGAM|nr:hypothetical protein OE88DRAFT_1154626 [Heliocybe sulcata]
MDNFSGALTAWKNINFSELQKTLDTQGIELVENQKESVVGRKSLADRTKVQEDTRRGEAYRIQGPTKSLPD